MNGALDKLAIKYGIDKSSVCHDYMSVYEDLLAPFDAVEKFLEIGVFRGKSLRMWKEVFPNARIYGIDNNPKYLFEEERITCFLADQSRKDDLIKVASRIGGNIDRIIDDGSHHVEDQILSARTLVPFLSEDGLYVIEDVLELGEVMDGLVGMDFRIISTNPPAGEGLLKNHNLVVIKK